MYISFQTHLIQFSLLISLDVVMVRISAISILFSDTQQRFFQSIHITSNTPQCHLMFFLKQTYLPLSVKNPAKRKTLFPESHVLACLNFRFFISICILMILIQAVHKTIQIKKLSLSYKTLIYYGQRDQFFLCRI